MVENIFKIFLFSLGIQRLTSYTTVILSLGGTLYEWEDYKSRTTSKALRLKIFQEQMVLVNVIPDLIFFPPDEICEVIYKTEKGEMEVRDNVHMKFEDVLDAPIKVSWDNCDMNTYYSLLCSDCDSPLLKREHQLWVLGNIYNCSLDTADVILDYKMTDINGTLGHHRFVFLVYKQPHKIDHFDEVDDRDYARTNVSVEKFAYKYDMAPKPVAGNYFFIDFTEYNLMKYPWRYFKKRPYSPDWSLYDKKEDSGKKPTRIIF